MLVGKLAGIGMQICWLVSQLKYIGRYVVWHYSKVSRYAGRSTCFKQGQVTKACVLISQNSYGR